MIKSFAPLKIKLVLSGGYTMDYKIVRKASFTVTGVSAIFKYETEWLPQNRDYEIAAGYHIEMYSNPADYAEGTGDENYYSEIWIPVRKK